MPFNARSRTCNGFNGIQCMQPDAALYHYACVIRVLTVMHFPFACYSSFGPFPSSTHAATHDAALYH